MLSVANVATPATAVTVVVPDSVPAAGFVPMPTVTSAVKLGVGLPPASCAVTTIAGVIISPATVVTGGAANARRAGGPMVMSKDALVAFRRPLEVAVSV